MQFFVSKYLHSIVEGRPPYHPPLGRHPFPGLYKKTIVVDVVVDSTSSREKKHSYSIMKLGGALIKKY